MHNVITSVWPITAVVLLLTGCGPSPEEIEDAANFAESYGWAQSDDVSPEYTDTVKAIADRIRRGEIHPDSTLGVLNSAWERYQAAHPEVIADLEAHRAGAQQRGAEERRTYEAMQEARSAVCDMSWPEEIKKARC